MESADISDDVETPSTNGLASKIKNISVPRAPVVARRGIPISSASSFGSGSYVGVLNDNFIAKDMPVNVDSVTSAADIVEPVIETTIPKVSYAETLKDNAPMGKVNFRFLESDTMDGVDVVLPRESVKIVHDRFQNTLYGYFLGKRLAFPIVDYFVKQRWMRFGIQKVMMNSNGFFFFQFSDAKGMTDVLKEGPWLIRNTPLFLNTWNPSVILKKDEVKKVTVWVRIHSVPLTAYTDDGLSMIATKIGNPKDMDTLTSKMCKDSWGKSSFARTMIELSADKELKEEISIAIPNMDDDGYHNEIMQVEYEWKPMRCGECCVFGHDGNNCPKRPKEIPKVIPVVDTDGFQEVKVKRKIPLVVKPVKSKFVYKPVVKKGDDSKVGPSKFTSNSSSVRSDPADSKKAKEQEPKVVYKPFNYKKMVGGAATSSAKGKEQEFSNNSFEALKGLAYEDYNDFEVDEEYDDYTFPDNSGARSSSYDTHG